MILIERVLYGRAETPKELREYRCLNIPGSPVGNIADWKDFASKQGEKKVNVIDFDESWTEKV